MEYIIVLLILIHFVRTFIILPIVLILLVKFKIIQFGKKKIEYRKEKIIIPKKPSKANIDKPMKKAKPRKEKIMVDKVAAKRIIDITRKSINTYNQVIINNNTLINSMHGIIQKIATEAYLQTLKNTPIEILKNEQKGIRLYALKAANINNIAELNKYSIDDLMKIQGIGETSAEQIWFAADKIVDRIIADIQIQLHPDKSTKSENQLIKTAYTIINTKNIIDEIKKIKKNYLSNLEKLLKSSKKITNPISWFFASKNKKRQSLESLDWLEDFLNSDMKINLDGLINKYSTIQNASVEDAWNDFGNNTDIYSKIIEAQSDEDIVIKRSEKTNDYEEIFVRDYNTKIEKSRNKEVTNTRYQESTIPQNTKIKINTAKLVQIRQEAEIIQQKLIIEDENKEQLEYKREINKENGKIDLSKMNRIRVEANSIQEKLINCSDQETDPDIIVEEGEGKFISDKISDNSKLDYNELELLNIMINKDNAYNDVMSYCTKNQLMPNVIIEKINNVMYDIIGDNAIEMGDNRIEAYQEYIGDIKMIMEENGYAN